MLDAPGVLMAAHAHAHAQEVQFAARIEAALAGAGMPASSVRVVRPSLEDVFVSLIEVS